VPARCLLRIPFLLATCGLIAPLPILAITDLPVEDSRESCGFAPPGQASPGYALAPEESSWAADCGNLKLRILFTEDEVRIHPIPATPRGWDWGISLLRFGGVEAPQPADRASLSVNEDRAEYSREMLSEWFRNTPQGIEHVLAVPDGTGSSILQYDFGLTGNITAKVSEDGQQVIFRAPSGVPVLIDRDLAAFDAQGREVALRWEKLEHEVETGTVLRLVVHAADHEFPLRVGSRITTLKGAAEGRTVASAGLDASTLSAPVNDMCGAAEVIPAAGPFPYDSSLVELTDATSAGDPPLPSCQPDVSHSVWFAFTPTSSASYTFSVCSDAPTDTTVEDTVLAVYAASGACAGLVEIGSGCSDDSCGPAGLQSAVSEVPLTAGTTYYIVAWSYGNAPLLPGGESLQLRVVKHLPTGPPPPNDQCGGAESIPEAGPFPFLTTLTTDISGATGTGDPPAPSCQSDVSRSIWYSFTPAMGGRYTFSVCADSPTGSTVDDTVLAVYTATASCSGFTQLSGGCDDDSCAGEAAQSRVSGIDLDVGTTYYIVVWAYSSASLPAGNTAIQMRVSQVNWPLNDSCSTPEPLGLGTPVPGTTVSAADDTRLAAGSPCFTGIGQTFSTAPGRDVAYRFTAPQAGAYSFRLSGYETAKNAVLYVASDCPAGAPPAQVAGCLAAANRTSVSPEEVSCLPLSSGQSVYVYVDEHSSSAGSSFLLEANRCPPETEPNGNPSSAGEMLCGLEGAVTPAGDADFFALGIPAAGSRLFAMLDGAAGNSTDFDLRLTTSADTLEYDDLNNDVPFGSVSPNISGSPMTGALSFLRVTHYSPAAQAEPYRLYACVQPPLASATSEIEPNDTIATASGGMNEYYSGALSDALDEDIFSLAAVAGESIQIGLDLDPGRNNTPFNGSLALLDSSGATLVQVNDPSSTSSVTAGTGSLAAATPYAPAESLAYLVRSSGTLYVRVAHASGSPGDYLLSVAHDCRVGPSTDVTVTQSDAPDPVLPGGTLTYSVLVRNLGMHPASVVTLKDDLPVGSTLVSAVPSQGQCVPSQPMVCHLGNLAADASVSVSITAVAPATPGLVTNTVRVSTAVIDSLPSNDTSSESSTVGAVDADGDGVPDASDCAPGNPSLWAAPGEATGLRFPNASDTSLLQWSLPAAGGATLVSYDLLRSTTIAGFVTPTCLVSGATTTAGNDPALPVSIFFYLVRSENACGVNLGTRSDGTPRTAGACP